METVTVTSLMEDYLSSTASSQVVRDAYRRVRGGSGSHDRNISPAVLKKTIIAVQAALTGPLSEIPQADGDFIDNAVAQVLPDMARAGIASYEDLEMAVQVVMLQLAAATDKLAELSAMVGDEEERGGVAGLF